MTGPARIAVLADIHGNLPALEAVLADVAEARADLIVLNGDIADGPFPAETLDLLAGLGDRVVWLRGNGDRWLAATRDGHFRHPDPETDALMRWAAGRITDAQRDRLAALPLLHHVAIAGAGRIGVCHATARHDNEVILVDGTIDQADAAFAAIDAATIVVGHTHMPFDRLFGGRRVVNAGSVGIPYGHVGASWALIGPDIVLRRTRYDVDRAADRILASGMPDADAFVATRVLSNPTDGQALDAFRATLNRQQQAARFD